VFCKPAAVRRVTTFFSSSPTFKVTLERSTAGATVVLAAVPELEAATEAGLDAALLDDEQALAINKIAKPGPANLIGNFDTRASPPPIQVT
jgi:hypothetical protein